MRFTSCAIAMLLWLSIAAGSGDCNASGIVVTTTSICTLPVYTTAVPQYSQVCRYHGNTYAAAVDSGGRPEIFKIAGAKTTVGYIDAPDFVVPTDGHCAFSIGIDADGYIHVTGGMHQGWPETISPLARYSVPGGGPSQNILYWKSNRPESVTDGFTFMGIPTSSIPRADWRTSKTIPGEGWQDGKFITDTHGELYYYSMVDAFTRTAWGMGDRAVGLYHYNVKTRTWTAIGGEADHKAGGSTTPYFILLFWEYKDDGWQNFQCTFQFDRKNRLHFATSCDTNPTVKGETRIYYASSNDGGRSWSKANCQAIPGFPLRGDDGQPNQIDIVAESASGAFAAWTAVTADSLGRPIVGNAHTWYAWNGSAWATAGNLTSSTADWATSGYGTDSRIYFEHIDGAELLWSPNTNDVPYGYQRFGYQQCVCLTEPEAGKESAVFGIGTTYGDARGVCTGQAVLKTTLTPAPLPPGWKDVDVIDVAGARRGIPASCRGFSGFQTGQYVVEDFGCGIDNQADDFHYVYTTIMGDCQIIAHIVSQVPTGVGLGMCGVMVRESLDNGAKNVTICTSPLGNACFNTRTTTNGQSGPRFRFACTDSWVKLERMGSTITAFTSADGRVWKSTTTTTVAMNASVDVGLCCAAYQNGYGMQTTTFDNVQVSPLTASGTK